MKVISLNIPEPYIKALDELVTASIYPNRAEAIRFAVRDLVKRELWERKYAHDGGGVRKR